MVCTIKFFWEAVVKTQLFYWTHHNNHTVTDKEWDITGNMLPALGHKKSFFFPFANVRTSEAFSRAYPDECSPLYPSGLPSQSN